MVQKYKLSEEDYRGMFKQIHCIDYLLLNMVEVLRAFLLTCLI
jgi:hypothetical protein